MTKTSSEPPLRHAQPFRLPPNSASMTRPWAIRNADGSAMMWITHIQVSPADDAHAFQGLIAFLTIEIDGLLRIDGVTLRMTRAGKLALSFPWRSSRSGRSHRFISPCDPEARTAIERTIFEALGINQSEPR